jgi:Phage gp6-like head-tail connector protein
MGTSYTVLSVSGIEPLSLEGEVRDWLRVDFHDEDESISALITRARKYAEWATRLALISQTVQALVSVSRSPSGRLSGPVDTSGIFPISERVGSLGGMAQFYLRLPLSPAIAVTTVEHQLTPFDNPEWTLLPAKDANNNDNYRLDSLSVPSRLNFAGMLAANRFRITYTAGYTPDTLPGELRQPMLSLIGYYYLNREGGTVPDDITDQLHRQRILMM